MAADVSTMEVTSAQHGNTVALNTSFREDCIRIVFSELEYLPWDNPENIVSVEVATTVRRVKDNMLAFLFLIGGPANVINMAVFFKQGLKDRVNVCLFSLSLADELYLISALLHYGEQLHIQFTTKETFGPVMTFLTNRNFIALTGFGFISPVLTAIIATERCLCVFNPLKFQHLLRTRTMAAIIILVYVLVLGLFFIVVFRYRIGCVYDPVSGVVATSGIEGEFYKAHKDLIELLDSVVFGFGLSGVVVIVVTTTTVLTIVKLRQAATWRAESSSSSSLSARELALTKMLVANSILFIVCIAPNAANRLTWSIFPDINAGKRKENFFLTGLGIEEIFTFINSTFNIFIYYVMGSRYRETFWTLFRRKKS